MDTSGAQWPAELVGCTFPSGSSCRAAHLKGPSLLQAPHHADEVSLAAGGVPQQGGLMWAAQGSQAGRWAGGKASTGGAPCRHSIAACGPEWVPASILPCAVWLAGCCAAGGGKVLLSPCEPAA
jgi:hypothetical protein